MQIKAGKLAVDIDKLIFSFIVIDALLLLYIGKGQSIIQPFIVACSTIRVIQFTFNKQSLFKKWGFIFAVAVYLFVVTITENQFQYVFDNVKFLFYPLIVLFYLSCLIAFKPNIVSSVLKDNYIFYNIYYFLNLLFMIYQSKTGIFYDSITGLIGPYGTHRLCMFVGFLVLINYQVIKEKKCKYRTFLIIDTVLVVVSTLLISSVNDNTAMYIFLPIVVILYIICNNKISLKTLITILGILLVCWICVQQLMQIESIASFLNKRLFAKTDEIFGVFHRGKIEEERYTYIDYSLNYLNGFKYGVGLGQIRMSKDELLSNISWQLRNWGMTSMASLIAVGGWIFMLGYVTLYTSIATIAVKSLKIKASVWILFLILFYYGITPLEITMLIFVCFMLYPFYNIDKQLE